jgi:hypothetical protein
MELKGESNQPKNSLNEKDYCRVKTSLLLSICPLNADIFVKLAGKFIKIYREGDVFDISDFSNITEKKKIEFLFIKKDNVNDLISNVVKKEEKKIQNPPAEMGAIVSSYSSLYESVSDLSHSVGFSSEVQILAKTQVKSMIHSMGKKPSLIKVLSRLDSFKGEYLGVHSVLTGYLACAICSQLDWGSEQTYYKLTLAAFLHDIVFSDSRLAQCQSVEEVLTLGYSQDKVKLFLNHPILAAEIARSFSETPPDVDNIIIQHHEIPDGTGFPKRMTHQFISPMSAVFFVGHKMAEEIIILGPKQFNLLMFSERMKAKYSFSKFRKIFEVLDNLDL